jgi:glycosyltransferase involved in cell wall biosynthesis
MKKYAILYDYQIFEMQRFGGISRYFCEIIQRLSMRHQIAVRFTHNYYFNKWRLGKASIPLPRFIYKHWRARLQAHNHKLARRLLTSGEPYIFHPTYYHPYFLSYIGTNPYVITVHDMIHEKFAAYVTDSAVTLGHKQQVIPRATRIIAISENTKKDIVEIFGIDPQKIDVIYHGTGMTPFTGRYRLKLPRRFLLFVGDRTPYKNFDRFMQAFARLRERDQDLYAIYTGNRPNAAEKEQLHALHILDYTLHIKASDRELSELYSRALLFVYPSLYEGFGIPILEAYACHCPVALSHTSCFPEIAGDAAVYFDPYSVTSIANTIQQVIDHEDKRAELIALGDEQLKRYSWETAAKKTEETYRKVMEEIQSS